MPFIFIFFFTADEFSSVSIGSILVSPKAHSLFILQTTRLAALVLAFVASVPSPSEMSKT